MNYCPANTRNHRLNLQLIDSFGYYIGGQDGLTFAAGFSVFLSAFSM